LRDGRWFYSPAFEVPCADTTGAGDVFHGAFCYALLEGMATEKALEFSNGAAALNCTAIGARGHVPTRPEVDALIAAADAGKIVRRDDPEIAERCRVKVTHASVSVR
jgi:sulfofructose kinase